MICGLGEFKANCIIRSIRTVPVPFFRTVNNQTTKKRALRYIFLEFLSITHLSKKITSPTKMLAGRNIIITGGKRGLGYCFAKKCVSEGA